MLLIYTTQKTTFNLKLDTFWVKLAQNKTTCYTKVDCYITTSRPQNKHGNENEHTNRINIKISIMPMTIQDSYCFTKPNKSPIIILNNVRMKPRLTTW